MGSFRTILRAKIQQRWVFAVMASLSMINAYTSRMCLSMAITEMVKPLETTPNLTSEGICTASLAYSMSSNLSGGGVYAWDEYTQGIILSSFYWGYTVTQIPGGILAEKFGGKYILGVSILSTGILTLLTPIVVKLYDSVGLVVLRIVTGIGEGMAPAAVASLISQWAPPHERTRIMTMVMSGITLGTVLGNALSGVLIQYSSIGWPLAFYFFGVCAIFWFLAWVVLCYSYPNVHPFISEKEKMYLQKAMSQHTHRQRQPTPWRQMSASLPMWGVLIGNFGFTWGFHTMTADLPKYMSNVLKFSIQTNGFLSALPHILTWIVGNTSSWLADWLIRSNRMSRTITRKAFNMTASVLSGIFLVAASYAGCDRILVVTLFTLGTGMMGFFFSGVITNSNDLSPNNSGTISGMTNVIGCLTGTAVPFIAGLLTTHQTLSEWRMVFWISAIVSNGASVIFTVWGDGEVQHWNHLEPQDQTQVEFEGRKASITVNCVEAKNCDEKHTESNAAAP